MTDPSDALASFQEHLPMLRPLLQRGEINPDVSVYSDRINGRSRFAYVMIRKDVVVAFAVFVMDAPEGGRLYFDLGYAVPEAFRNRGLGKAIVKAALDEMAFGFSRAGVEGFIVNAVVSDENMASQRVAAATLAAEPNRITDAVSGSPALHYRGEFTVK